MDGRRGALPLMLTVIALSCAGFYAVAVPHVARASLFFIPISLALVQMLLHHLSEQPGWPRRFGTLADLFTIAAVVLFIAVGAAALSPIIRNATSARLGRMLL